MNIAVRFTYSRLLHALYYGTIENISKSGMLMRTGTCFPSQTDITLFLYKEKILMVHAKVMRAVKAEGFYRAMGIKVIEPGEEYVTFIDRMFSL